MILPDKDKVKLNNEADDTEKVIYTYTEIILFLLVLIIISAFAIISFIPLFCIAQIRNVVVSTKTREDEDLVVSPKAK